MTGFTVSPSLLEAAGIEMCRIAGTVSQAHDFVGAHSRPGDGGKAYLAIAGEVYDIRDDLMDAYAPGGPAESQLYGCGYAFMAAAGDYRQMDAQSRAEFDAKLDELDPGTLYPTDDEPDIDLGGYDDLLSDAEMDKNFEDYAQWQSLHDTVDAIIGFDWIDDVLGKVGITGPISAIREELEGDWTSIGYAVGAMGQAREYWGRVGGDVAEVRSHLANSWTGNASDAAMVWLEAYRDAAQDHSTSILKTQQRVRAETMAVADALTTMQDAIDNVGGLLAAPENIGDGIVKAITSVVTSLPGKVLKYLDIYWNAFKMALAACRAIVAGFAQLTRFFSLDWPSVPSYDLDVDGPRR